MGQSPDIDKVSDKDQFKETIQAMDILGFDARQVSIQLIVFYIILLNFFEIKSTRFPSLA